jgi:hypothetical protein
MSNPSSSNPPPGFFLTVNEDGKLNKYPLFSHVSDWSKGVTTTSSDNTNITLNYSVGGPIQLDFLASRTPKYNYKFFNILNKTVSFTVDVSQVPHDHNFALYTSALTTGDVYKDAQSKDSRTEIDLMEANRIAYHFTAHKRFDKGGQMTMGIGGVIQKWNKPANKFVSKTTLPAEQLYGVGKYIDTRQPFRVSVTITPTFIKLLLTQNGKHIWQQMGGPYLASLLPELQGTKHVLICSLWYGEMDWLSGGLPIPDESQIQSNVRATVSDISITTIS